MSRLIDANMLSPDRDYYENSYNSGYDAVSCQQIDNAPTVKAISLDRVKKVREEIQEYSNETSDREQYLAFKACLALLDELIKSEEK